MYAVLLLPVGGAGMVRASNTLPATNLTRGSSSACVALQTCERCKQPQQTAQAGSNSKQLSSTEVASQPINVESYWL